MPETAVDERAQTPAPPPRGQRLWAVLLVLDSFFVITFGGTLAMKAYQHWEAPVPVAPKRTPRAPKPVAKAAEPAPAPEPPKPEPPKTEAAKAPEPAKPARKPAETPAEAGLRPPKPSLLHEAPTREKAGLQGPAVAAADEAKAAKAVPTDFSIKAPGAKSVELAGAFLVRSGGKKAMVGHPDGTWTLTLYLTPNSYRYWFLVNGKKTLDPQNGAVDRGASVRTVAP